MAGKAGWHHIIDKATGEPQHVASLDGIDLDLFEVKKLPRAPKPNERVEGGALKVHPGHDQDVRARSTIAHLTHADLVAIIAEQVALALAKPAS